jgi:hypothetical protein
MTASALARTAALLVVPLVAGSCASGPSLARDVAIEAGRPTRVLLTQVQTNTTFLLQNASSVDPASFYRDSRLALGKIVDDDTLQALLDVFSEKGMFAASQGTVPPNARDVLVVEQGDRRWIWARRLAGTQAEATFHEAKGYFLEVYNSSTAYRGSEDDPRPDLQQEKMRVRQEADAAKNKLEHLDRKPR